GSSGSDQGLLRTLNGGGPWPRQARVLTGGRWISRTIPPRAGEGRQHRGLGDVAQANNCLPDLLSRARLAFPLGGRFTASHGPGSSGCSLFFHLAMAGFYIDLLGNLIQGLISFFFFVESLLQEIGGFVFSQQIGISPHCAVASNLVVFYPLSSGNQSGVFYFSVDIIFFFKDLTALLYQTFHAFAFLRFGFLAYPFEVLFYPLIIFFDFVTFSLECVAQLV